MKRRDFLQTGALGAMLLMTPTLLKEAKYNKKSHLNSCCRVSFFAVVLSACFFTSCPARGQSKAADPYSVATHAAEKLATGVEIPVRNESKYKYLFIDDQIVGEIEGLRRQLHQPEKKGIVLKPDQSWEMGSVSAASAPIWVPEEGVYKWVYHHGKNYSGLAISKDGINWEKPRLGMVEFDGSKDNNIFSDQMIHKVVYDPHTSDPDKRYKGIKETTLIVSGDLVNWKDAGGDLGGGDSGSLTYDEQGRRFLAPLKILDSSKDSYRAFNLVTSEDFKNWSEPHSFFDPDEKDQEIAIERIRRWLSDPGRPRPIYVEPAPGMGWTPPEDIQKLPKRRRSWNAQCGNISVFPYQGLYIALIRMHYPTGVYLPGHGNNAAFFMVELASTRDLKEWNRLREPFIEPARLDQGIVYNYERMLVSPVNRPIIHGDELWFYYTGTKEHTGGKGRSDLKDRYSYYMDGTPRDESSLSDLEREDIKAGKSAIYLATLRLDGFVSLTADQEEGYVLTKPIKLDNGKLYLNLACAEEGHAWVEIIDESEQVIAISEPVVGDGLSLRVSWKEGTDISKLSGQTARLKIHLKEADLYSFWTE